MRITAYHIEGFGALQEEQADDLDRPGVVVLGGNEAGKSTLFHFFKTILYGLHPPRYGQHPYAPTDGTALAGSMTCRLSDDTACRIARHLHRRPEGELTMQGETRSLDNRPLPFVQHVPQAVYEAVYALERTTLTPLDETVRSAIWGRLLGTDDSFQEAAEAVVTSLEEEAVRYGFPSGKDESAAALEQRWQEVRQALQEARLRENTLRELHAEVEHLEAHLNTLRDEHQDVETKRHRAERLGPAQRLIRRLHALQEKVGNPDQYEDLPEAPRQALDNQEEQIEALEKDLAETQRQLEAARQAVKKPQPQDSPLLDHRAEIRAWTSRVEAHEKQRSALEDAKRRRREAQERLEEAADQILEQAWYQELADPLRRLSRSNLRNRMRAYEEAVLRLREEQDRASTLSLHAEARRSIWPWGGVMLLGIGIIGVALGRAAFMKWGLPIGGAVALFGGLQLYGAWQANRRLDEQRARLDLEEHKADVDEQVALLEELLADLPVDPERLHHPDRDMLADLEHLKEALGEYDRRAREVQERAAEVIAANEKVDVLASACGVEVPAYELAETVAELDRRLERAEARRAAAAEAREQLPLLEQRIEQLRAKLTSVRSARTATIETLKRLGEGSVEDGIEVLDERRRAVRQTRAVRDTLEARYPDWRNIQERVDGRQEELQEYSEKQHAQLKRKSDVLSHKIAEAREKRAAKMEEMRRLQEGAQPAALKSQKVYLEAERTRRQRQRDRLVLLARLIKVADRSLRQAHQPPVLERASAYLERLTEGRYVRLTRAEDGLRVWEQGGDKGRPVRPPLSQGTRDQIQLAFRLAAVGLLDAHQEPLPLFFDEVFVNWDTARRREALHILADMTDRRQVVLFTCHPYFAREATDFLQARQLKLGG